MPFYHHTLWHNNVIFSVTCSCDGLALSVPKRWIRLWVVKPNTHTKKKKKSAEIQSVGVLDLMWGNSRGLNLAMKSCEWICAVSQLQFQTQSSEKENAAEPDMYYISILMQKIQSKYFASHSFASSVLLLPVCWSPQTDWASQRKHTKTESATFVRPSVFTFMHRWHTRLYSCCCCCCFFPLTHMMLEVWSWFTCSNDFIKGSPKKKLQTQSWVLVCTMNACIH